MDPEEDEFETFDGFCFAKVSLKDTMTFDLALVCWYDFKFPNTPSKFYKYECPYLQLTDIYNMIP
ncbi:7598_t:CDS:2, partial [Cetraspora pellucida]